MHGLALSAHAAARLPHLLPLASSMTMGRPRAQLRAMDEPDKFMDDSYRKKLLEQLLTVFEQQPERQFILLMHGLRSVTGISIETLHFFDRYPAPISTTHPLTPVHCRPL